VRQDDINTVAAWLGGGCYRYQHAIGVHCLAPGGVALLPLIYGHTAESRVSKGFCGVGVVLQGSSNWRSASQTQPLAQVPSTLHPGALLGLVKLSQLKGRPCLAALAHLVGSGRPPAWGLPLAPQQLLPLHLVLQQPQRQPLALRQLLRLSLTRRQHQRLVV
jgi:hypothetical protein